ncbi:hypothetical protein MPLA_1830029 [Mesorhizobium sp. ORS 3359]|nr:hypothetical protein MPLA_1830029 [Mesorhizobium sp. ORS 3359]
MQNERLMHTNATLVAQKLEPER